MSNQVTKTQAELHDLNKQVKQSQGLGSINLKKDDLPHSDSKIEWWYMNAHIEDEHGNAYSLFASFFKLAIAKDKETNKLHFAHTITWALTDLGEKKYYRESVLDRSAPAVGLENIKNDKLGVDKRMQAALKEILDQNKLPFPDTLASKEAILSDESLFLDFENNILQVEADGSYTLNLVSEREDLDIKLRFKPLVPPAKHGDDGCVVGAAGENMYYYFIPKNEVHGSITKNAKTTQVFGSGWYDHEFAASFDAKEEFEVTLLQDVAWNWVSLQLNNGVQVTAYDLFDQKKNSKSAGRWSVIVDGNGQAQYPSDFQFIPKESWTSTKTFNKYPIKWELKIPERNIDISIEAVFPEQEFITLISEPAFWEGRVQAKGIFEGKDVSGPGYIEVSGFGDINTMEDFLKAVTKETRKAIENVLPLEPSDEDFISMVASTENAHFLQGLSKTQYIEQVIKPIREIIDRGGKSWRSFAAIACMDIVGGDSQPYVNWLAWPELLHTGSLIIDDVQDGSITRRGGTSCHVKYGIPIAINAGNAAYFLGQPLLLKTDMDKDTKLKIYEIYFETMRAAHAGQAMDISSFYAMMDNVVESGNADPIEEAVLSVHRLKSAVPSGMLARIGATAGKGTKEANEYLGRFFEALGLAFQIMDDVLNLKGFEKDLKEKGEDIRAGKITMPVVKSMAILPKEERKALWSGVKAMPTEREEIARLIAIMDNCGAIQACSDHAAEVVEESWQKLQEYIIPSQSSLRLRAFSWFVLNRHY